LASDASFVLSRYRRFLADASGRAERSRSELSPFGEGRPEVIERWVIEGRRSVVEPPWVDLRIGDWGKRFGRRSSSDRGVVRRGAAE